jgi:hypothetical protein
MTIDDILKKSIDLHIHIGNEIIPRKFNVSTLTNFEKGKLAGVAVKNHFFPTVIGEEETPDFKVIHSITLNHSVGGLNPEAVRVSAQLAKGPIIVWFPTIHAKTFLEGNEKEILPEWIDPALRDRISLRDAKEIAPITIFDEKGELSLATKNVLKVIKEFDAILATGHLSWQESKALVTSAIKDYGIKRVIVTHPIYQRINMSVKVQKELADLGAYIEQCYSMYAIDKIPVQEIAGQIKQVGADRVILSSDAGQTFIPAPSEALKIFSELLMEQGITLNELEKMLVTNSTKLITR